MNNELSTKKYLLRQHHSFWQTSLGSAKELRGLISCQDSHIPSLSVPSDQRSVFLSSPPPIQKRSSNQILGTYVLTYSYCWSTKRAPKIPTDLFRIGGPQSRDSEEWGIYQACQLVPSCHFTMLTQISSIDFWMLLNITKCLALGLIFVEYRNTL